MERPTKPCFACGSNDWRPTSDGRWLCTQCHPLIPGTYSPDVLALRDRVIKGNDILFKALLEIEELVEDREVWSREMDRLHEARLKLDGLCTELKAQGYEDCLYMENGQKTKSCLSEPGGWRCQVCSSDIKYWEQELMSLPGPWHPRTTPEFDKDQAKFLETLGGQ